MYQITIQCISTEVCVPKKTLLQQWAKKTLEKNIPAAEMTIRIVDINEMSALNRTYRHKSGPTNVLSFPFFTPKGIEMATPILGSIVICAEIVNSEAREQNKLHDAHWAHMIVHGIFHLLGYDHEIEQEAKLMEAREIAALQLLGFSNPYESAQVNTSHE